MRIVYASWKQIICSDAQRILYGIIGGKSNKGDQAIQNFNRIYENPGLWAGFTHGAVIPRKIEVDRANKLNGTHDPITFNIPLANSRNSLKLWEDKNDTRKNPIKINQQIWNHDLDHAEDIIETWYVAYMRIILQLLDKIIENDLGTEDTGKLRTFIQGRLEALPDNIGDVYEWVINTQDMFSTQRLDTGAFLGYNNIKDIQAFVQNYYYLVIKYIDDNGNECNAALVANIHAPNLHPQIRALLASADKGGEKLNIEVSGGAHDPEVDRVLAKLYREKNIILYGAPGTGKTRLMTMIQKAFVSNAAYDCMDSEAPISLTSADGKAAKIKWCTFHPDYSYEEFVWGLKPKVIDKKLGYTYHRGPFLDQVAENAHGYKTLLIIDEINRANTDDVFGDMIRLLDKRTRGAATVPVPTQMGISGGKAQIDEDFYVIGTMNSLDKSVSPLTPELKRTFSIVEIMPDEKALADGLAANSAIPKQFSDLVMKIWTKLNHELHDNVGKEYMLGQGYMWDVVLGGLDYEATFADILRHKIIPHLKDVYPEEKYVSLFGTANYDILYRQLDTVNEICDIEQLSDGALINAFAVMCGDTYAYSDNPAPLALTFEIYNKERIESVYNRLMKYKNLILAGPSGTGKTSILEAIRTQYSFDNTDIMYWHNSTGYDDVIEGISAAVNATGDDIDYDYKSGAVKRLADASKGKKSLMGIENLDKSNAGENFGELITLLEPDKRSSIAIEGYTGPISLPEDMYFLCTMNPVTLAQNKMDSALKRRFVILEMYPDYKLLGLWFGVSDDAKSYVMDTSSKEGRLKLALELLRSLNTRITNNVSVEAQLGHAVMWSLKDTAHCTLRDIAEVFDETIFPMIEDFCSDAEIAYRLLGQNTPLLKKRGFGVELVKFAHVSEAEWDAAFKEMLESEA